MAPTKARTYKKNASTVKPKRRSSDLSSIEPALKPRSTAAPKAKAKAKPTLKPTRGRKLSGRGSMAKGTFKSGLDAPMKADKFKKLPKVGSFTLPHDRTEKDFTVGDCVIVNGAGGTWYARIDEIRGTTTIWAKIAWFYTETELSKWAGKYGDAELIKAIKKISRSWPPYELVASTHYDYISANSIEGHIQIAEFNEDELKQEIIPSGAYFTRSSFDYNEKTPKKSDLLTASPCSKCGVPYNPYSDQMRYCPRETCGTWRHSHCLNAHAEFIDKDAEYREALARTTDAVVVKPRSKPKSKGKGKKPRGRPSKASQAAEEEEEDVVPPVLAYLARLPIIRGPDSMGGMVGNAHAVMEARKLIAGQTFDQWELAVGEWAVAEAEERIERGEQEEFSPFECPTCEEVI